MRRPDQVMQEVSACLRMLDEVYAVFGLTYSAALSTRPEGFLGSLEQWDRAEDALKQALDATGKGWEVRARAACMAGPDMRHQPGCRVTALSVADYCASWTA
jgi:threonyl-tRNA synthetase